MWKKEQMQQLDLLMESDLSEIAEQQKCSEDSDDTLLDKLRLDNFQNLIMNVSLFL